MAEYLKARECTNNGIVQLELDKFLKNRSPRRSGTVGICLGAREDQKRSL